MAMKPKREARVGRHYARSATKKGWVLRRPAHLGRIIAILAAILLVTVLALVWGSYLKAEADARAAAAERGEWTLDPDTAVPVPVDVPDGRAMAIRPQGNVGDILIAGEHDGVILPLGGLDGALHYISTVGETAHAPISENAVSLPEDVARVQKRGLYVVCVFAVTCLNTEGTAESIYRQGLELALLREYAEAGMDEILLLGLPSGSEEQDWQTVEFLNELKELLQDLETPPAIGVALPPVCFTTEDVITGTETGKADPYAGNMTPARILSACDSIAMDLRDRSSEEVAAILPRISYAYVRYSMRLLLDVNSPAVVEDALSHGFDRIFEMESDTTT